MVKEFFSARRAVQKVNSIMARDSFPQLEGRTLEADLEDLLNSLDSFLRRKASTSLSVSKLGRRHHEPELDRVTFHSPATDWSIADSGNHWRCTAHSLAGWHRRLTVSSCSTFSQGTLPR